MSDGMIVECELKIESVEIVLTKSPFLAAAKKGGRHTLGIAIDYLMLYGTTHFPTSSYAGKCS